MNVKLHLNQYPKLIRRISQLDKTKKEPYMLQLAMKVTDLCLHAVNKNYSNWLKEGLKPANIKANTQWSALKIKK